MLHSRDHDRRRRAASSSEDDENDEAYEDPGADATADVADAALASMAQHVFRRGVAPSQTHLCISESSSSGEESFVDDELEPTEDANESVEASREETVQGSLEEAMEVSQEGLDASPKDAAEASLENVETCPEEAVTALQVEDVPEANVVAEPGAEETSESPSTKDNTEGDNIEGETGEATTPRRRELEEPPIPRRTRFFLHDDRFDEEADNGPSVPLRKSRADCEWRHDMFERYVATRSSPRFHNRGFQNDRPKGRWVPKGSQDQLPLSPAATTSVPNWAGPGSQATTDWRPDGYNAHLRSTESSRGHKRWVPKQTVCAEPEPETSTSSMDANWGAPEPVQAPPSCTETAVETATTVIPETKAPEPVQAPPSCTETAVETATNVNPETKATTTTMNPEAQEFQLPTTEEHPTTPMVYPSEVDPASMGYWMSYDGVMMEDPNTPSMYEYGYPADMMAAAPGVYYIASPYDTLDVSPQQPLVDQARSDATMASTE